MESGEERYVDFAETKNWKWGDTGTMRIISGIHITSYKKFLDIARYQAEKGSKEIAISKPPGFSY